MRKVLVLPLAALSMTLAVPADAVPSTQVIVLPGAVSAEGITAGRGSTFYASDLFGGEIFRGDIRRGMAELFIDAPDDPALPDGTKAVGLDVDPLHNLLFVAGGDQGAAYVYDARTGAGVATYQLGEPGVSLINDVTVTPFGAWFTDSLQPQLFFIPISDAGLGTPRTLQLSGPAAGVGGVFFQNGITSTPSGDTLLVAPTPLGKVCTVDPLTGTSTAIDGITVSNADGLVLDGRQLWVVQSLDNTVSRWWLSRDFSRGHRDGKITNRNFHTPLGAAKFGDRLAVVNAHLDTGYPPTNPTYEVVVVSG